MAYDRKDHFYKRAKREGKASRAVYKLEELQKRFRLIKKGDNVLDLGSAPGGWLMELAPLVGPSGAIIGIDLLPLKINPPKSATFILADLNDESSQQQIEKLTNGKLDVIISDMSPNLSGVAFADAYKSYELCMMAFLMCQRLLKKGGHFLVKIFPGDEFSKFIATMRANFEDVNTVIPEATRKTSSERYVVCLQFRGPKT